VPNVRTLPSPADLVGKVVIKSKQPGNIFNYSSVLNDDFDDKNRAAVPPSCMDYDSEDDMNEAVIGFKSTSAIKSPVEQKISLNELFQTAKSEASQMLLTMNFLDAKAVEQQAQRHADALLRDNPSLCTLAPVIPSLLPPQN
jgi:hypothetical protein